PVVGHCGNLAAVGSVSGYLLIDVDLFGVGDEPLPFILTKKPGHPQSVDHLVLTKLEDLERAIDEAKLDNAPSDAECAIESESRVIDSVPDPRGDISREHGIDLALYRGEDKGIDWRRWCFWKAR